MSERRKMVRVRVAVAVDSAGWWNATGSARDDDAQSARSAMRAWRPDERTIPAQVVWVEADVPLPAEQTVPGAAVGEES
jgi:hypothetical protein